MDSSSTSYERDIQSKVELLIDKLRGIGRLAHQWEDILYFLSQMRLLSFHYIDHIYCCESLIKIPYIFRINLPFNFHNHCIVGNV